MAHILRRQMLKRSGLALAGAGLVSQLDGQPALQHSGARAAAAPVPRAACACTRAADGTPLDTGASEMIPVIARYQVELAEVNRRFLQGSALYQAKLADFYTGQLHLLETMNFDAMSQSGKVDYLLLRSRLIHEQKQAAQAARLDAAVAVLLPFQQTIFGLEEARRRMDTVDPKKAASDLAAVTAAVVADAKAAGPPAAPVVLNRAAIRLEDLRAALAAWFNFYDLYDPTFAWWLNAEYKTLDKALEAHAQLLHTASGVGGTLAPCGRGGRGAAAGARPRGTTPLGSNEELAGAGPAGEAAIIEALREAWIPYSPSQLIAIANREFAWCDAEMLRASQEMGFGKDWKRAQEKVKSSYVPPGQMIIFTRDSAREAIAFMEAHDVLTIPQECKEDYWEQAMSPAEQLVSPFFLGGSVIQVASAASSMTLEDKLESMRANNIYQARDTVFHELVPGHHMQGYMTARYRAYRGSLARTPFWTEGMAFYWEMLMWDLGYTHTPEQRVGALFWRMHRCARIIFSLSFHLGKMTPLQCVQFLIDRVGFEKASAEGEVRRSFNGSYEPIYQCAYMLGALQFHALHKELVLSGKMTNRAFHDAFYVEGNMPVEMVRAAVAGVPLTRDYQTSWKFYGDVT